MMKFGTASCKGGGKLPSPALVPLQSSLPLAFLHLLPFFRRHGHCPWLLVFSAVACPPPTSSLFQYSPSHPPPIFGHLQLPSANATTPATRAAYLSPIYGNFQDVVPGAS